MTVARRQLIDPQDACFVHCMSRCVRRAFLCGVDKYTGKSFEHRKQWVEDRLLAIADCFAVGLYAYAVMSNHLHVVLYVNPDAAQAWTDEEVARRWTQLFPRRSNGEIDPDAQLRYQQVILAQPEKLAEYRQRLSSVSWFMRCLSEPIARMANSEDVCSGRFWEGRYKCQLLLDSAAVLACMAYVDLNPIRAGLAIDLVNCHHTSIVKRIQRSSANDSATVTNPPLRPLAGPCEIDMPGNEREYLDLVDYTGRVSRYDKRGKIPAQQPLLIARLGLDTKKWQQQSQGIESHYWRAIGSVDALIEKAKAMRQTWLKGAGTIRRRLEQASK